ncbi:hypothetical protein Taro_051147, partial [Colocasia esculenta]|nr:hypothetical protein [Colocasia esculenta]
MANMPKQEEMEFLQQGEKEDQRRGAERKKTQRPEGSVVVDMEGLFFLADAGVSASNTAPEAAATASPRAPKTLTRKFSQRSDRKTAGDGDALIHATTTSAAGGGDGKGTVPPAAAACDKFVAIALPLTAVTSEIAAPAITPAAAAAGGSPRRTTSCKRAYSRRATPASPWLDPRRVLLFFATLSSMGTIILLYFTLSMGTMGDGGDANARVLEEERRKERVGSGQSYW